MALSDFLKEWKLGETLGDGERKLKAVLEREVKDDEGAGVLADFLDKMSAAKKGGGKDGK